MTTEQETLEKLRVHFYAGREPAPGPGPGPGQVKVKLDDLAGYLAAHPGAKLPKGKPMTCAKCGQTFRGGAFRACYSAGWFCRGCYGLLALAPLSARCIHCKQKITIDDWRYKLWSVVLDENRDLKRYFVHQDCKKELARLEKAA